jgi:hypothetical protein
MSNTANRRAETPAMDLVPTPVGTAGITWYPAHGLEIPAANHTFDTPGSISRLATMRLITDETLRWIERQLTRT